MAVSPKKIPKWPSKHMKRCSTSFVIGKIQIKTTMKYYFIATMMAIIMKTITSVSKDMKNLGPSCTAGGNVI